MANPDAVAKDVFIRNARDSREIPTYFNLT